GQVLHRGVAQDRQVVARYVGRSDDVVVGVGVRLVVQEDRVGSGLAVDRNRRGDAVERGAGAGADVHHVVTTTHIEGDRREGRCPYDHDTVSGRAGVECQAVHTVVDNEHATRAGDAVVSHDVAVGDGTALVEKVHDVWEEHLRLRTEVAVQDERTLDV